MKLWELKGCQHDGSYLVTLSTPSRLRPEADLGTCSSGAVRTCRAVRNLSFLSLLLMNLSFAMRTSVERYASETIDRGRPVSASTPSLPSCCAMMQSNASPAVRTATMGRTGLCGLFVATPLIPLSLYPASMAADNTFWAVSLDRVRICRIFHTSARV